jgi:hypothetical protein
MTVQSDLSPEGTNRRKTRAVSTAQTLALFAPGNTLFRKFQKIHYSFFNSSVLRAEGVEPSDLQELSQFYAELSRGVTRTEMERTKAQDSVNARVLAMLDRLVQNAMLQGDLPDDWSPAQAMTLLANTKVRDVFEENGSYYTDGVDLSLAQVLLKEALDQEKAEHIRTWETDQQLQAKHARLRALTIGNKVADRQNAEAAFVEIFGELVFFDALGSSTGSFAPNTTPNQWLRAYRTLDAPARAERERLFKLEPEYLNRKDTKNPPYSLSELKTGAVSPYHTMLDALMAVGRSELSMREDGSLTGSMPEQSDRAGAAFKDSHASVRQALTDWRKMSRRKKSDAKGAKAVQEFFNSDPGFARSTPTLSHGAASSSGAISCSMSTTSASVGAAIVASGSAGADDGQAIGVQVPLRRLAHLLLGDRANHVGVTLQEVEAEAEAPRADRERRQVAVAFEGEHEAAGQVVLHVLQFLQRRRLAADAADLVEEAVDRALAMLRRGADVSRERTRLLAGARRDAGADGVAEPLLVA